MQALEFLKNPASTGARPFVAVFGEDAYLRREAIGAVVRLALGDGADDLAVTRFPGDSTALADVLDEVRTLPFLAKCRVALVEDADKFVTAHRKELEAYAERPAESGVLVLMVKSWPGNTKLAKLVDKTGLALDCRVPEGRELAAWRSRLPGWLDGLAKASGAKLDGEATRLLIDLVGDEPGLLAGEVEKLATYVGARKTITRDDVAKMVGGGRVEQIWSVIDAATTGKGSEALHDLDRLLSSGAPPIMVLAGIRHSLIKVHHAGQLRRTRVEAREAIRQAGITYPAAADKVLAQHTHLGPSRVDALPELLMRADFDLKGGTQLTPRAVLERLLVELSRPRRD